MQPVCSVVIDCKDHGTMNITETKLLLSTHENLVSRAPSMCMLGFAWLR